MSEISAASSEQSKGIEQVNQAITQMDEVTQQNAALVEEAAAAAESLEEEAQNLSHSVGVFKLAQGLQVATVATRAVANPVARKPAPAPTRIATTQKHTSAAKPKPIAVKPAGKAGEEWEEF
jgi:methyl-accepting chemotaxis protein